MAGFRIRIGADAKKDFESLPHPSRRHINRKIHFLKEEPRPKGSEPLGYGRFLLTVPPYGLLYTVDEAVVTIVAILKLT